MSDLDVLREVRDELEKTLPQSITALREIITDKASTPRDYKSIKCVGKDRKII